MDNRPVGADGLGELWQVEVGVNALAVGQDALIDPRDAKLLGDFLELDIELVVAFDDEHLRHDFAGEEVVDGVVTEEEPTFALGEGKLAELGADGEAEDHAGVDLEDGGVQDGGRV